MNFIKRWFSKTAVVEPKLSPEEVLLFKSIETEPAKWSVREIKDGLVKLDHRDSGVWIILSKEHGRNFAQFNRHFFSEAFTLEVLGVVTERMNEVKAKEMQEASKATIELINREFSRK